MYPDEPLLKVGLRTRGPCIFDHSSEKLRDRKGWELRYSIF